MKGLLVFVLAHDMCFGSSTFLHCRSCSASLLGLCVHILRRALYERFNSDKGALHKDGRMTKCKSWDHSEPYTIYTTNLLQLT